MKILPPASCILSKFYIKPQRRVPYHRRQRGCILSKFYIKPQQSRYFDGLVHVVSYRNSTSNHNSRCNVFNGCKVVSYRNSTSNHNFLVAHPMAVVLYLIEILHQTTTYPFAVFICQGCILSKFYIKPQLLIFEVILIRSCILSKFYIKPQPGSYLGLGGSSCILSKFYIKPQPSMTSNGTGSSCILSKFYIKPQR